MRAMPYVLVAVALGTISAAFAEDSQDTDCFKVIAADIQSDPFGSSGVFSGDVKVKTQLSPYGFVVIGDRPFVEYSYTYGPLTWDRNEISKMGDNDPLYELNYYRYRRAGVSIDSKQQVFVHGSIELKKQWNKHCVPLHQDTATSLSRADWDQSFTLEGVMKHPDFVPPNCKARAIFSFDQSVDSGLQQTFIEKTKEGYEKAGFVAVPETDDKAFLNDMISVKKVGKNIFYDKCTANLQRYEQRLIRQGDQPNSLSKIDYSKPMSCKRLANKIQKLIATWNQCETHQ